MRTIWKFGLSLLDGHQPVLVPDGGKLVHVGVDPTGMLALWFEVNSDAPKITRKYRVFGTGHPIPPDNSVFFVGTAVMGDFVWHIYEVLA